MYLLNDICKLKPLFDIDYSKKKDIISASFFKMQGGGYRDFNKYLDGILKLIEFIENDFKPFVLRLFIDHTIYNDKEIMSKLNNSKVEIVVYECSKFIKDSYHRGIFGMIVRFFPMFNFENNDANKVIISDIDFVNSNRRNLLGLKNIIKEIEKNNLNDISVYFRGTLRNTILVKKGYIIPYVISPEQINFKRIDKEVILNYLNNYDKYKTEIIEIYKHSMTKINKSNDEFIFYGWDEYFINANYINYIIKNKLKFMVSYHYFITINLFYINKQVDQLSENEINILKDFYNEILIDDKKFNYVNLNNSFFYIDKLFFERDLNKLNDSQINISMNIYKYYIKNFKNKEIKSLLGNDFINILLSKYYLGKISYFEDKVYNDDNPFINVKYNILPDEKVKELNNLKLEYGLPDVLY